MDSHHDTTIMVVDDTPANLRLLDQTLQEEGYRVTAFPRGQMALKAAVRQPPDLILLDINMPDMDGYQLCQRLKENSELKEIPVIFISAGGETAQKLEAFAAGGVDYVTKPFQLPEVKARVHTHLKLRWTQLELEKHNQQLETMVRDKVQEISEAQIASIMALSKLTEIRDYETGKHIERVQHFCRLLAETLRREGAWPEQLDGDFLHNIFYAAPLHDIGKVGISDLILLKPGRLTSREFEVMKRHVDIGADTLEAVQKKYPRNTMIAMGIDIARFHHERWDGTGYPRGLAGEDIPLAGRIMGLADVYDAMRSQRPYKQPFTHRKACHIIRQEAGTHFDPALVEAFLAVEDQFAAIFDRLQEDQCEDIGAR